MKRVICLYRVSTVGQVDHDDIPIGLLAAVPGSARPCYLPRIKPKITDLQSPEPCDGWEALLVVAQTGYTDLYIILPTSYKILLQKVKKLAFFDFD